MAAINFPSSPSNGDTFVVDGVTYTYNSAETKWKTTINSNAFLPLSGGTVSGNLSVSGNVTVDTNTLYVDSTNNRVGIGTASPNTPLHVQGDLTVSDATSYGQIDLSGAAASNDYGRINFQENGTTRSYITDNVIATSLYLTQAKYFSVSTNSTERLRVTSGGDLQFNSGYGSVATAYGCRAWVNFDGTGTVAIRASGNVSSITDNGTGDYTVNFTTAMPDANYGTNVTMAHTNANSGPGGNYFGNGPTPVVYQATGLVRVAGFNGSNTGTYYDSPSVSVAIFR